MYAAVLLIALWMIYQTGKAINGSKYTFGRFLQDLALTCLLLLAAFGIVWLLGGPNGR